MPGEVLQHWNLDPLLLGVWLAAVACSEWAAHRNAASRRERRAFRAGAALALAAWVSPLCALGVASFSARVVQHLVLALLAAPLLARGWPLIARSSARSALGACFAFGAATWLWHAPAPYDATFRSDALYWASHLSLLGTAVALWRTLLRSERDASLTALACALVSSLQMGLLGALLTFAPAPLFESHLATTAAFGLSPLEDQQLGGLALWIPGCGAFLAIAARSFARSIASSASRRPPDFGGAQLTPWGELRRHRSRGSSRS